MHDEKMKVKVNIESALRRRISLGNASVNGESDIEGGNWRSSTDLMEVVGIGKYGTSRKGVRILLIMGFR